MSVQYDDGPSAIFNIWILFGRDSYYQPQLSIYLFQPCRADKGEIQSRACLSIHDRQCECDVGYYNPDTRRANRYLLCHKNSATSPTVVKTPTTSDRLSSCQPGQEHGIGEYWSIRRVVTITMITVIYSIHLVTVKKPLPGTTGSTCNILR